MSYERLNILYHHRTQGKGVEGVHIREMVRAWKKQGHKVDVIGPPGVLIWDKGKERGASLISRIYKSISRYIPEVLFEFCEIIYNYIGGKKLQNAFKHKNYDLFYERYALLNWSGVREAKRAKVPVILEVNYTSHTPLYRKRSKLLKPLAHRIEKWVFENADGIVVVSTYLKEHLLKLGVNKEKIVILTNAADPEVFTPDIHGMRVKDIYKLNGKTVVGFVGGFYPWHGLDFLLEALGIVSKRYDNIALLLIGDGPMRPYLEKKVFEMGLKEHAYFTGTVSHNNLPEYISVFDIAVMPHSNEYGSPMKIYEYMAMGKPVVAPRFGPLEDGITHGVEGLLFGPKNTNELAECLEKLLQDVSLREDMGQYGRKRVISKHNWEYNAKAVIKVFTDLVKTRKIYQGKNSERQPVYI